MTQGQSSGVSIRRGGTSNDLCFSDLRQTIGGNVSSLQVAWTYQAAELHASGNVS